MCRGLARWRAGVLAHGVVGALAGALGRSLTFRARIGMSWVSGWTEMTMSGLLASIHLHERVVGCRSVVERRDYAKVITVKLTVRFR